MYIKAPRDDVVGGGPDPVPRLSPAARFFLASGRVESGQDGARLVEICTKFSS